MCLTSGFSTLNVKTLKENIEQSNFCLDFDEKVLVPPPDFFMSSYKWNNLLDIY